MNRSPWSVIADSNGGVKDDSLVLCLARVVHDRAVHDRGVWNRQDFMLLRQDSRYQHVLHSPAPFVLQTALNDFYVAYELNAYTNVPTEMQFIYSHLHQNIQDRFNEAGVEICSPHFASLRDGNRIAIPEQYVSSGYTAPGFRVNGSRTEQEQTTGKPG